MSDQAGDELQRRLDALSPEDRTRLERALLARRRRVDQLAPRDAGVPAVLSSAQRRLWFFDRLAPGTPTYNAIVALWLSGPVDLDLLEQAFGAVVARHEVLHSVIGVPEGVDEPIQHPLAQWQLTLGRHVATGTTPDDRRQHALDLARELARAPYDLAHDLMLRVDAVQVDVDECLLVVGEHHIAFDGWSDEIMFAEVSAHYAATSAGLPAPAPPALPVQYADYAVWQRRRLDAGALATHADHWRNALTGAPAVAALPLDRERPVPQRFEGRHLDVSLAHAAAVRAFRAAHGATDYMVLVAAWAATVYRWSGETDLVLGTPMANRNRVEVEQLIGFFSNTVPLRIRIDGSAGFADLVEQVREVALRAFDHQDLPFDLIVEAAAPPRVPGANPLFCVNVRVQSGPQSRVDLPGVTARPVHVDIGFSRFDLAVELQMETDRIGGYLEYNEAVLDRSTADELLVRLDLLLGAALVEPRTPLWSLPQPSSNGSRRSRRRTVVPALASEPRPRIVARLPRSCVSAVPDDGEVAVHWLDLSRPVADADLAALSADELDRAAAFRFDRHRDWFLRRRAHLRRILAARIEDDAAALRFAVDDHGRPHLVGPPEWSAILRFSTSSSQAVGLVTVSEHDLGADVEELVAADSDREVARRMFAPEEVAALEAAPEDQFTRLFFNCWTRKEAYVKATGLGLSFPLESFAVDVSDTPVPALLRSDLRPDDLLTRTVRSLEVPWGGAAAAVVVSHHDPVLTCHTGA